jgi:DNA recombination protein RmuC
MELGMYIVLSLIIGVFIGWLIAKTTASTAMQADKTAAIQKYGELEREFTSHKATVTEQLQNANTNAAEKTREINGLKEDIQKILAEKIALSNQLSTANANLKTATDNSAEKTGEINALKQFSQDLTAEQASLSKQLSTANADLRAARQTILDKNATIESQKAELKAITEDLNKANKLLATATATNDALEKRLSTQKEEMEVMGRKFNTEFENIANKILETKSEKFTKLNSDNLKNILEPLGQNINEFKKQVNHVYQTEANERFSLGEKVKELAELNKVISQEAQNLTKALKGEAKTQGRWGEMILESILERSGLVKNQEYFMEHELRDENGNALQSASEGKKMRPDVVIKYPDNRNVIIDSKVSLNAFTRLIAATDVDEQQQELANHISAIKNHIVALSTKGYDDYDKALDFVMMFIPTEPAYIAALQGDPDLWNYAYDRRILLLSPTNLITSLKLIVDLWKREYQNQNAIDIAKRGALLYDKFVGFVNNLEKVGKKIEEASGAFESAKGQLSTGSGNLVQQAIELKNLGLKTKKELPTEIENTALGINLPEYTDD